MSKTITWIIVLLVIVGGIYVLSNKSEPAQTGPIKIGLSVPLTGDLAFIGETDREAALIAMEEIKNQNGLKHEYQLVIEDDGFDAAKGASVMNKFVTVDKVDMVISIGSTVGNVISPLAESNKIPHIGVASDPVIANGEYNFIHWTRPQEEVSAMIEEMQKRNITKVAIIGVNQQGVQAINDDFKKRAKEAGINFVEEIFNPGQTDFRTIISKLQKENPQIYLLEAFDPEIGVLGKQIRNLGIKTPLTSIESFGLTTDPSVFEGQWYIDGAIPTGEFDTKYQSKYNKIPGPGAPNFYDAINLFVKAVESIPGDNKPSSSEIAKALSKINDYNGALGALQVNSDGIFISQAAVKVIKNGKSEALK